MTMTKNTTYNIVVYIRRVHVILPTYYRNFERYNIANTIVFWSRMRKYTYIRMHANCTFNVHATMKRRPNYCFIVRDKMRAFYGYHFDDIRAVLMAYLSSNTENLLDARLGRITHSGTRRISTGIRN